MPKMNTVMFVSPVAMFANYAGIFVGILTVKNPVS